MQALLNTGTCSNFAKITLWISWSFITNHCQYMSSQSYLESRQAIQDGVNFDLQTDYSFINSWNFFNTGCLITSNSTLKFHPNSNDVTLPNILQHINQQTSKKQYKHVTCWWGSVLGFFFQSIDLYFIPKFTPAEALVVTENCLLEPCRNKQPNFFGSYKAS